MWTWNPPEAKPRSRAHIGRATEGLLVLTVRRSRHLYSALDFRETVDALKDLEDQPVALDSLVVNPGPGMKEEHLRSTRAGFLALYEPEPASDRPVDEAAWWCGRRRDRWIFTLQPGERGGLMISPERFGSAKRQGDCLEIEAGAFRYRIIPLIRSSGKPVQKIEL